jgi:phospholipid/cholesterol/gamma-HCH transport system substrate-binding protein
METRARYVIIGTFVLAVIFAGFGFVYWLKNIGGLGDRAYYRIRFERPVSGLGPGSGVLFNGLRVGTIQSLDLDPADLRGLVATVSVMPWTPVHADTKVEITFQGLTGSPAILLHGGTLTAPRLTAPAGQIPLLAVPGNVGTNLNDSARNTLDNINTIIDENRKPLNSAITGISTFADMLGRNSKKIEGMLDGLDKMLGGGTKETPKTYDLAAATQFPATEKTIKVQMAVADPRAVLAFDTQKILTRSAEGIYSDVGDGRWADNLPKLVQAKFVESFENAGLLGKVSGPFDALEARFRLETTIRGFQISLGAQPTAQVEFAVRILGDKGKVLDARIFKASAPAKGTTALDAVAALDKAFAKAASELVGWSVDKLATVPGDDDLDKPDDMKLDKDLPAPKPPAGSKPAPKMPAAPN